MWEGESYADTQTSETLDNWFTYHVPIGDQPARYETIRRSAQNFAWIIEKMCPPSADRTVAFRKIREAVMIANASIACGGK